MSETISIRDFAKLDLRVGEVKSVELHPNADKLLVLKVDLGEAEPRQMIAGLKGYYEPEELVGLKIVAIVNLEPAVLRGVESQGMLLAAVTDDQVVCLTPEKDIPTGARIS